MTADPVDISVVICSHNRADGLRLVLQSLVVQETADAFRYEIVVIHTDTPGTEEAIQTVATNTQIPIRSVKELRRGGVLARNRGIDEASGVWLALFDDDQTADPQWLKALWDVAHKNDAKNVGGSLRLRFPTERVRPLSPMCRRLLGETAPWNHERPYTEQEGPGTGNQMIHRSVFDLIGRWDPAFTLRGYDSDLYSRMHCAGILSWFTPHASGVHFIPESRLTDAFFQEVALHNGWQFAKRDLRAHGRLSVIVRSIARIGQAILCHAPMRVLAKLSADEAKRLDRRVKMWRAEGYVRSCVYALSPWFPQRAFFSKHEFRVPVSNDSQQPPARRSEPT